MTNKRGVLYPRFYRIFGGSGNKVFNCDSNGASGRNSGYRQFLCHHFTSQLRRSFWYFAGPTLVLYRCYRDRGDCFGLVLAKVKNSPHKLLPVALSLVLGGAIGNFLDRALTGEVVDFVQLNFGSYTFPIFNIADSAICIGVALIIVETF